MSRFLLRLRLSVRWRLLIIAVLAAYCLPVGCVALVIIRLPAGDMAVAPAPGASDTADATAAGGAVVTETPARESTATRAPLPATGNTPTTPTLTSVNPENDPMWDYRQSVDLRAELCARLNVPVQSEAYKALCAVHLPVGANTAAPIIAYLEAAFTPGKTTRAEVDACLSAYRLVDGVYALPVRAEQGRTITVRVAVAFDGDGVYTGFDIDAGVE